VEATSTMSMATGTHRQGGRSDTNLGNSSEKDAHSQAIMSLDGDAGQWPFFPTTIMMARHPVVGFDAKDHTTQSI